ncbi:MAG: hypothetical protein HKO87_00250 [Acidimicrobiia bacterium]|nr:hypothetical protein [Acidimicrobiia bacterium]
MFRLVVAALAIVGLVSLFFGSGPAAAVGVGFLAIPLILAKVFFFVLLLGFIARGVSGHRGRRGHWRNQSAQGRPWMWQVPSDREGRSRQSRRSRPERPSREDDFEEWHRMAHARKEVDDWAPPVV